MAEDTIDTTEEVPEAATEESSEAATPQDDPPAAEVSPMTLADLGPASQKVASPENLGRVLDVSVPLTARVGLVRKTISDVVDLIPGTIIDLERAASDPIDVVIGEKLIARGEIVVVDDRYGIRVVEIIQD